MFLHERKRISQDGAFIDCIRTDRFRFSSFSLTFSLGRLSFSERQALYALSRMMENGSESYPSPESLSVALSMLYDAEIDFTFTEAESGVLFHAEADFADTPAIGEDLLSGILTHIRSTLERPFPLPDGGEALLARVKEDIRGDCAVDRADPDAYSYSAYKDRVYSAYSDRLTEEGIRAIPKDVTLGDVKKIHSLLLGAPMIYAFSIGKADADRVKSEICSRFPYARAEKVVPLTPCYPGSFEKFTDTPMGSSSRLYLGYSSSCEDLYSSILAIYLGGVPVSRLYTVLREENRYCYSVYAERQSAGLLTVSATVGKRLEERSKKLIEKVIEETKIGADPSVLSAAKQAALSSARGMYESRRACERFFFASFVRGEYPDNEQRIKKIEAFGEKELTEAARGLNLCREYILPGERTVGRRKSARGGLRH